MTTPPSDRLPRQIIQLSLSQRAGLSGQVNTHTATQPRLLRRAGDWGTAPMSINHDIVKLAHEKGYHVQPDGVLIGTSGRPRKLRLDDWGYPIVSVRADGYRGRKRFVRAIRIAALVAYAKFGTAAFAPGIEVRHLDGDKQNHRPDNIDIGTRSENEMDRPVAERSARARHAVECRWGLASAAREDR